MRISLSLVLVWVGRIAASGDIAGAKAVDVLVKHQVTAAPTQGVIASNICGWLGGNEAQPWTCAVSYYSCLIEPQGKWVGCCTPGVSSCGAFRTACYAQTDPCDENCSANVQNLLCSGYQPICATYTYPSGVLELRCEATTGTQFDVEYTYSGFKTPILLPKEIAGYTTSSPNFAYASVITETQTPPSTTAAPSSTPSSPVATSTPVPSQAPSSTYIPQASSSAGSNSGSNSGSDSGSSSSSPTPVGAIVGGVIGGLAIIAAVVVVALWFRYKSHAADRAAANEQRFDGPSMHVPSGSTELKHMSQVTTTSPVTSYGSSPGHYVNATELPGSMRQPQRDEPVGFFNAPP